MLVGRSSPVMTFDTSNPSGTALAGCDGTPTRTEAATAPVANHAHFLPMFPLFPLAV